VFGVMSNGRQHVPVDMRLYLPKVWIDGKRFIDPTFRRGMAGGSSPCAIDSTPA
jgi:hypothetical protein